MARTTLLIGLLLALGTAAPAFAREPVVQPLPAVKDAAPALQPTDEPPRPVTDKTVTAVDVVATPVSDLNLRKDKIPPILLTAQERPYELGGLTSCARLTGAIGELDAVLGSDIDLPQGDGDKASPGSLAQSLVGALIPFRGLIREVSGANAHDRRMQTAIVAGAVRRGFLKGIGQQRGCAYPARPAPPRIVAAQAAALQQPGDKAAAQPKPLLKKKGSKHSKVEYVAKPVVQPTR